jgi:hypothetical protein
VEHLDDTYILSYTPEIIVRIDESIWPSALGAFLGALFAFAFGLIAFYYQKIFERYWKHRNAIIEIEHLLNDHLNNNTGNQYLVKGAINTLVKNNMPYTLLNQFRLPDDIHLRIGDLVVLNKYAEYKDPVEKVNHGMTAWQGLNERLHQNVISNPGISGNIVHTSMNHLQKSAEELYKFLILLDTDTTHFLAYIRIYLKKNKYIWSIGMKKHFKSTQFISDDEIQKEFVSLKDEIKENSKKSRERIAQVVNN